jgi:hypothetical protein
MTTTRIWYTPAGSDSATFDVPGASDDPTKIVNLTNFVRQENNRYRFQYTANAAAQANLSATNWPVAGNTTITSYTFAGGGTIPASQGQILINGRWELAWNLVASNSGTVRQLWTFQSVNHIGGNTQETVDSITAPAVTPRTAYSPYAEYFISAANVTGGAANTIQDVKFFANTSIGAVKFTGANEPSGTWDVNTAFVYTTARRWEVNLHSTGSTVTSDHDLTVVAGILHSAASELVVDTDFEPQAQNLTGFRFVDRGDGVHEGTLAGELYVDADYADLDYFAQSDVSVSFTPDRPLLQQYTQDAVHATTAQLLIGISMANSIDVDFAAAAGRIQQATVDITIDAVLDDVVPGLLPGGTVQASIEVDSETTAVNRVFTLALDYVDPDYADLGYFEQSNTATDTFTTEIDLTTLADSSIIRSDGSISLEADFGTTVIAGFQITAGVILAADAALDIAPYITGGAGVIRAIAAELTDEFVVPDLFLGQSVELQADLAIEFAAAGFAVITKRIQQQLEIALELSVQAIAAPPILGTVALEIDLQALAVPALFLGFASPSVLEIGPITLEPFAGYTLFGQFAVTQGITADFVVAGSTFRIDDYFTAVVRPESRRIAIPAATGQIQVGPETRVNTIQVETRGLVVEPETRRDRIAINPATLEGNRLRRYNQ